jgi:triosephosphate isomerase
MLQEVEVQYVVIGHSERRQYYNETDASVNAKTKAALAHRMTPIVCVGETLEQREAGETDNVVKAQIEAGLEGISPADRAKIVFAYEPVWAIGTGKVCEADEANRVCSVIRETIGVPICRVLYGGSVKPDNVAGLMAQSDIDGGLVGGASLQPESFLQLIEAAMPVKV